MQTVIYVGESPAVESAAGVLFVNGAPVDVPDEIAAELLNRSDFTSPGVAPAAPVDSTPPADSAPADAPASV